MSIQRIQHHIQADIFAKLRHEPTVRYKNLKEPGLEPSQFTYHLKELMKQKLVEKTEEGSYRLASAGVELAQHFSSNTGNLNQAPLSYTLVFLRYDRRALVCRAPRQTPAHWQIRLYLGQNTHARNAPRSCRARTIQPNHGYGRGTIGIPRVCVGHGARARLFDAHHRSGLVCRQSRTNRTAGQRIRRNHVGRLENVTL